MGSACVKFCIGSATCGHEKSDEKDVRVEELSVPCVNVTRMRHTPAIA